MARNTSRTRKAKGKRAYFRNVRRHERMYARQLRHIAKAIDQMVRGTFVEGDMSTAYTIQDMLKRYADTLTPWARAVARRMVEETANRDEQAWGKMSKELGLELGREIRSAPIGEVFQKLMNEQVHLIRSIPMDAAQRVHDLTMAAASGSVRAGDLVAKIMEQGHVSKSKATLIARTEVARTSSTLVQARAMHVGSEGYIWRTVGDSDVRKEHRVLNGKFFKWNDPPIAGPKAMRYHAGAGPNCRCYPEPVIPD